MTIDEKSLDEAIQHARYVADEHSDCWRNCENIEKCCKKCEYENKQIAEWLEELKEYKKNSNTCPMCDTYCSYIAEEFENGYNKAIDDFVEFASTMPTVEQKDGTIRPMWLKEMAEQLKEGGENEQNI